MAMEQPVSGGVGRLEEALEEWGEATRRLDGALQEWSEAQRAFSEARDRYWKALAQFEALEESMGEASYATAVTSRRASGTHTPPAQSRSSQSSPRATSAGATS